jgi:hypothetical protein
MSRENVELVDRKRSTVCEAMLKAAGPPAKE